MSQNRTRQMANETHNVPDGVAPSADSEGVSVFGNNYIIVTLRETGGAATWGARLWAYYPQKVRLVAGAPETPVGWLVVKKWGTAGVVTVPASGKESHEIFLPGASRAEIQKSTGSGVAVAGIFPVFTGS